MTMTTCIFDAEGLLINIGPWDYGVINDDDGHPVITNPLPDGATSRECEVVTGWDGGLYLADDPRRLGAGGT